MNYIQEFKDNKLIGAISIFISWWIILYATAFTWGKICKNYDTYMLVYYTSVIIIVYLIYLVIIPKIIKIDYKIYFKRIGLFLNKETIILSIFLILSMIIGFILRSPIVLTRNSVAWFYTIQPPLVEELLFRGIIPYLLFSRYNKKIAFSISVILFAGIHILNGPVGILVGLFWGILFLYIKLQCKSIVPLIIIHYIVNAYSIYAWLLCIIVIVVYECYYFKCKYQKNN